MPRDRTLEDKAARHLARGPGGDDRSPTRRVKKLGRRPLLRVLTAASCLLATSTTLADAPTPQFGGCAWWVDASHKSCRLQAGPTVTVTLGKYERGKFAAGFLPGLGYGLVLYPDRWYALGLGAYGQLSVGTAPNTGVLSLILSFANYVRLGLGETWEEQPSGPAQRSTALLFGLGSDVGGSPRYVRKAAE